MKVLELRVSMKCLLIVANIAFIQLTFGMDASELTGDSMYLARQENLRSFFGGVSSYLGKPIIVSKLAATKKISGEFDLAKEDIVGVVSKQLGLITYDDGNAMYIYDVSEIKNRIITLHNIGLKELVNFLEKSGLTDSRYPLRGDGNNMFYISGPPIYIDLVTQSAEFMDGRIVNRQQQRIEVIKLNNTFATDRSYTRRDDNIIIPGIATVVNNLLEGEQKELITEVQKSPHGTSLLDASIVGLPPILDVRAPTSTGVTRPSTIVRIIAYPETNSLLIKGTLEQIQLVRNLVKALDEKKRQVELSLWIIDLQKDDLDQLGVNWQGSFSIGSQFGAGFNKGTFETPVAGLEGMEFIASIMALERDNKAQIVSRPVLLTQENTPAMFDNNRTFYTPLISERAVELQHVTYGTLIHVLPRFTDAGEVELSLNIEDGNEVPRNDEVLSGALPTVGRTKISTVARVPKGRSLLIGGYTRGESGNQIEKIPILGDLPFIGGAFRYRQSHNKNTVRVFLITPREIDSGIDLGAKNIEQEIALDTLIKRFNRTSEVGRAERVIIQDGN